MQPQGSIHFAQKSSQQKQNQPMLESKEQELLDFSSMFKKNGLTKRPMPKLGAQRKVQNQGPNWLLQIPSKLQITKQNMQRRRYLDEQKWNQVTKISKSQDQCLATIVTALNWLIKSNSSKAEQQQSILNLKQLKNILSQSKVDISNLNRKQTFINVIDTLHKINRLNIQINLKVHELIQQGKNEQFLQNILTGLKCKNRAFVYLCYEQILCPIGYENTPLVPLDAYKLLNQIRPQDLQMWIIFARTLKNQAPLLIKRWKDIEKQLTSRWPQFVDLEETKKGRQNFYKINSNQQTTAITQNNNQLIKIYQSVAQNTQQSVAQNTQIKAVDVNSKTVQISCWIELSI